MDGTDNNGIEIALNEIGTKVGKIGGIDTSRKFFLVQLEKCIFSRNMLIY